MKKTEQSQATDEHKAKLAAFYLCNTRLTEILRHLGDSKPLPQSVVATGEISSTAERDFTICHRLVNIAIKKSELGKRFEACIMLLSLMRCDGHICDFTPSNLNLLYDELNKTRTTLKDTQASFRMPFFVLPSLAIRTYSIPSRLLFESIDDSKKDSKKRRKTRSIIRKPKFCITIERENKGEHKGKCFVIFRPKNKDFTEVIKACNELMTCDDHIPSFIRGPLVSNQIRKELRQTFQAELWKERARRLRKDMKNLFKGVSLNSKLSLDVYTSLARDSHLLADTRFGYLVESIDPSIKDQAVASIDFLEIPEYLWSSELHLHLNSWLMRWLFGTHRKYAKDGRPLLVKYFPSIQSVVDVLELCLDPAAFTRKGRQFLAQMQGINAKDAEIWTYVVLFCPNDVSRLQENLRNLEIHDVLLERKIRDIRCTS